VFKSLLASLPHTTSALLYVGKCGTGLSLYRLVRDLSEQPLIPESSEKAGELRIETGARSYSGQVGYNGDFMQPYGP